MSGEQKEGIDVAQAVAGNWWKVALLVLLGGTGGAGGFFGVQQFAEPQPVVVRIDETVVAELRKEMVMFADELRTLNRNMGRIDLIIRNNWDRYEQYEFSNELEMRLNRAGVQVLVPKPQRRVEE